MVGVINYNMGNVASVINAVAALGWHAQVVTTPKQVSSASKLILPGVGAFGDGMRNLKTTGLQDALEEAIIHREIPILGICLGMQLFCKTGFEFGVHDGMGWIDASVRPLAQVTSMKVPHVGWNDIHVIHENELLKDTDGNDFYFVHSYYVEPLDSAVVAAQCHYGIEFACAVRKNNIYGTQFHPEKSQKAGLSLLRNFLAL